jgi:hypothetical protein
MADTTEQSVEERLRALEAMQPPVAARDPETGLPTGPIWPPRAVSLATLPAPPVPAPGSVGDVWIKKNEERIRTQRIEAEARERQLAQERAEGEAERRRMWEETRPEREAALAELDRLEDELEDSDTRSRELRARRSVLLAEVNKYAKK